VATAVKRKLPRQQEGGKFRVIVGSHLDKGPEGCECSGCAVSWAGGDPTCDHKLIPGKGKYCKCGAALIGGGNHLYEAYDTYYRQCLRRKETPLSQEAYDGDIIDSTVSLVDRFNQGTYSRKFERVHEQHAPAQATPPPSYPLEKMNVPQLVAYAEEEEIDLRGAKTKEEILRVIRAVGKMV